MRELTPIPASFVVEEGLKAKNTEVKRQPYIDIISHWAEREGMSESAKSYVDQLIPNQCNTQDPRKMKDLLKLKYRSDEFIENLRAVLTEVNSVIVHNPGTWTWAQVMRVMTDASILNTNIASKFESLVLWLLPDKKKESVRKHGDYCIMDASAPWYRWRGDNSQVEHEARNYMMCKEISQLFESIIIN